MNISTTGQLTQAMDESLAPRELSQAQRARVLDKVLARARDSAPEGTRTQRAHPSGWQKVAPNVRVRLLSVDAAAGTHVSLIRLGAGGVIPGHRHDKDEEFLVLEGECHIGNHHLVEGDTHFAASGTIHGAITTCSSVLVYLRGQFPYPSAHVDR
jgi:quercetin dioxygenase-like cupin family protein